MKVVRVPFSLNFKTSLYLESMFWLNGSASFANFRLDKSVFMTTINLGIILEDFLI